MRPKWRLAFLTYNIRPIQKHVSCHLLCNRSGSSLMRTQKYTLVLVLRWNMRPAGLSGQRWRCCAFFPHLCYRPGFRHPRIAKQNIMTHQSMHPYLIPASSWARGHGGKQWHKQWQLRRTATSAATASGTGLRHFRQSQQVPRLIEYHETQQLYKIT